MNGQRHGVEKVVTPEVRYPGSSVVNINASGSRLTTCRDDGLIGKWLTIFAICLLQFAMPSDASSGTEGAAFLEIPVGAAPAALGSAYSALAHDAYAPVWNPAGLGLLNGTELAGQHLSYLESIRYEYAGAVLPLGDEKRQGVGASIQYLGSGDITGRVPGGALSGDFTAYYAAYSLAYGCRLRDQWSVGVTGKAIQSKLSDASAQAYAADVGTMYQPWESVRLAATVDNVGTKLKFEQQSDPLPLAWHLAAAYRPNRTLMTTLEGVGARGGSLSGRLGLEWKPLSLLALRAGYRTDTLRGLSAIAGMSTGLGLEVWGQDLAYAWVPYGELGDTQYFSLVIRFGGREEARRNLIQYQSIKRHRSVKNEAPEKTDLDDYPQLLELLRETPTGQALVAQKSSISPTLSEKTGMR